MYPNFGIATIFVLISVAVTAEGKTSTYDADDLSHPCLRDCVDGETPRTCEYDFAVEWYYVLSKACYDCPFNGTDCDRPHCVAADGVRKAITVVNRRLPGPGIFVCQNDTIIVNVKNKMSTSDGVTIHWHGILQEDSPHMDGVAMITQCPIPSHSTFRYEFKATTKGTHFWHAHSGMQRADGVFGPLVVRLPPGADPHHDLYDYDLAEHYIIVTDWLGDVTVNRFVAHHHRDGDNKPQSMLINGKGAFEPYTDDKSNRTIYTPYAVFNVTQGKRYRFRVASNGILNCPIQISVDGHNMTAITSDGKPFDPIEIESFNIFAGERYDFVLNANARVDNYWIRVVGLADCANKKAKQVAILRYNGAPIEDPKAPTDYENMMRSGKQLNPWNTKADDNYIPVVQLNNTDPDDATSQEEPDVKFYLAMDFNKIDNELFHNPMYYPVSAIDKGRHLYSPQINHISNIFPPSPPMTQYGDIPKDLFCNEETRSNCTETYCECVHMLEVKLGQVVEIVMVDEGFAFNANHPMHLHGFAFRVVALRKINQSVTVEQIKQMDRNGEIPRKLKGAVKKDSVTVPDGGFTIIRFHATNPGAWLLHCHIEYHVEIGMGLIVKVGEPEDLPKPPRNFPRCGTWQYEDDVTQTSSAPCPTLKTQNSVNSVNGLRATCLSLLFMVLPLLPLYF
ncbi:laccase-4-like [Lingula anatina]|uniref:Laccase-4-like n=1 Tax=Lingula anatina TaxID=7574 RepID=A0A1S3JY25_LINAN|nr:laccase-4-like [Lingula anatina]|eukprot:XP_013415315.1 laccase-4-like [Lingula anatina]